MDPNGNTNGNTNNTGTMRDLLRQGCEARGDSDSKLPENTTDAGKKGSKTWNDAKNKINKGRGKGVNTKTGSQETAEELLNEARPELERV